MIVILFDIFFVERLFVVFNVFERCFGLKMNLKKINVMWIGVNKGFLVKLLYLDWVIGVKNLGIYFLCQKEEVMVYNFEERLNQI